MAPEDVTTDDRTDPYRWAVARLPMAEFAVSLHGHHDACVQVATARGIGAIATVVHTGEAISGAPVTAAVAADDGPSAVELGERLVATAGVAGALEVLGPAAAADQVSRVVATTLAGHRAPVMRQRLWVCTTPRASSSVAGHARPMAARDLATIAGWMDDFSQEALRLDPRGATAWRDELRTVTGMRVWDVDGQPTAMAMGRRSTPVSARIGPVFTPRNRRGHGYAAALTAAVTHEWLDAGLARVVLLTDVDNPGAARLYGRVGYADVGGHESWVVRTT